MGLKRNFALSIERCSCRLIDSFQNHVQEGIHSLGILNTNGFELTLQPGVAVKVGYDED